MTQKSLPVPPADRHGLTDIAQLPTPPRVPTVHIDFTGPEKGDGKRQYFATWGSAEMAAASETCEGTCCLYWRTSERKPVAERLHRPWRSQCFYGDPAIGIARWSKAGYEVHVHNRTGGV